MAVPESKAHQIRMNGHVPEPRTSTMGLKSLQSAEAKKLFDIVDRIRDFELNREIDLPQLVVCGSQSSGKSSVLEAISEVPFPRGEMTCTRFVTELRFRRHVNKSVQVQISPDKSRSPQDRARLEAVSFSVTTFDQLPELIKEAEKTMGLSSSSGFSGDVLKVQIMGPDVEPLTLVDLPGLIESDSRGKENIDFIRSIVDRWISGKRSIILAVVEANNDAQKQGILTRAREVDPDGERTFGIITKPDLSGEGSALQRYWIEHAKNSRHGAVEFDFKKGWHVLLNRNFKDVDRRTPSEARNANEKQFFQDRSNSWHTVDPAYWGITSLRDRLKLLLFEHTKKQLPLVRNDILALVDRYEEQIDNLGAGLQQPKQLWKDFERERRAMVRLVTKGVDGKYNDPLFGDYDSEGPQYLRSRVEQENDAFQREISTNGHGIRVSKGSSSIHLDQGPWVDEVKKILEKTKGEELPGHTDPQRLDLLFWKHSRPWHGIALAHVEQAHRHCQQFIDHLIHVHLARRQPGLPKRIGNRMAEDLRKSLRAQRDLAKQELQRLEEDRLRSTKTRNVAFGRESQQARSSKLFGTIFRALHSEDSQQPADVDFPDFRVTPESVAQGIGQEGLGSLAEELGKDMLIYYKIALEVFVDNVLVQVIERHLLADLHTLFYGDLGIDQAAFLDMLNDDDYKEREAKQRRLVEGRDDLQACLDELSRL